MRACRAPFCCDACRISVSRAIRAAVLTVPLPFAWRFRTLLPFAWRFCTLCAVRVAFLHAARRLSVQNRTCNDARALDTNA